MLKSELCSLGLLCATAKHCKVFLLLNLQPSLYLFYYSSIQSLFCLVVKTLHDVTLCKISFDVMIGSSFRGATSFII